MIDIDAVTARTEPCNCWGGPEHRKLIIECPGGTLLNVCEWVYELIRQVAEQADLPGVEAGELRVLAAHGIIPDRAIPLEWHDALLAASD